MDSFNPLLMPISTPLSTPMSATDATDRSSHKKRSYHYSTPSQSSNQPRPSSLSTSSSSRPMSSHKKSFSTADVHAGMLLNPARERQSTPPRDEERSSTPATASIYHSHPVSRSASLFGESGCSRCGSRLTTRGQVRRHLLLVHCTFDTPLFYRHPPEHSFPTISADCCTLSAFLAQQRTAEAAGLSCSAHQSAQAARA